MNPLDYRGPQFLVFYAALLGAAWLLLTLLRRALEAGDVPQLSASALDPYLFAYLRGGEAELARAATISLLDRGLLEAEGELVQAQPGSPEHARRPLESAILSACEQRTQAWKVIKDERVRRASSAFRRELIRLDLVAGARRKGWRLAASVGVLLGMWGIGWAKLEVARARGHHNIGFLEISMLITPFVLWTTVSSPRTRRGDAALEDFQRLFAGLRERAAQLPAGGATQELAMVVGLFGVAALPEASRVLAAQLFPLAVRQQFRAGDQGSSSSYTSCGTGVDSGCGSSGCGGGGGCGSGCGGGCGGCGS